MLSVVPKILFGLRLECLPAGTGTEVVNLTLIYEFINGSHMADLHAANRILEVSLGALLFHHCLLKYLRFHNPRIDCMRYLLLATFGHSVHQESSLVISSAAS
jgi:hypothetical protein